MLVSVGIETWTKGPALVFSAVVMHTKHVTLLNIFIPWFDYISFDMLFGERHLTYSSICVSDSLCLHFSRSLFSSTKTHRHTPNLLPSPVCIFPSLSIKGAFLRGPWSLPEDYQWRQSTLMLLLHAEISTTELREGGDKERNKEKDCWI